MSSPFPVLAAVNSEWHAVQETPVVGKDVLELLSSSMYVNPLSIYREYVQNSADALEEASAVGLLGREQPRIDIRMDDESRTVVIRDNGTGIRRTKFVDTLIRLGASRKRGTKARGFRGVGRLAGLGYCQELIFRSRSDAESEISELRWDCKRLREALRDPRFSGNVEHLIKDVVRERRFVSRELPERFFEVELSKIVRHGNDVLINADHMRSYLAQVAPVPFSPEFSFTQLIEQALRTKVQLSNVLIYINDSSQPVYRPHTNDFDVRKGVRDTFADVETIDINDSDGRAVAAGWILHHGYHGALPKSALVGGLRLRSGNIQVGEAELLDHLFPEPRFNSWSVGEIHVLDERILPNGRRDHFEQSSYFNELLNKLIPHARRLTHLCRKSSLRRNAMRQFSVTDDRVREHFLILKQGVLPFSERKKLERDVTRDLKKMEKISSHSALELEDQAQFRGDVHKLRKTFEKLSRAERTHKSLRKLTAAERTAYQRIVSLLYECSSNRAATKRLIDKFLAKI